MAAAADEERLLAALAPERVGLALVGQALEVAVDGGEADPVEPPCSSWAVTGRSERPEGVEDGLALLGSPAHRPVTIINLN